MASRKILIPIVIAVILALAYSVMNFLANKKELPQKRPKKAAINYVKTQKVAYQELDTEIEAFGRIVSSQPLSLVAEVGGKLTPGDIPLKEGQNFRFGQVLARIYQAEAILDLQSRKSEFLNLVAAILPDMKIDFPERYEVWQSYFDEFDMTKDLEQLPEATSSKEKTYLATKNILRDYYSIKSQEETMKKRAIMAPYNGSFTEVNLEIGSVVSNNAQIANIIRTDQLELEVPIEVKDVKWISEGTVVKVSTEDEKSCWTGRVARKADYVNPNTQSVNVYITVSNNGEDILYDGLYLKAVIPGAQLENAMEVPRNVVFNNDQVFVLRDSLLESHTVSIEKINQNNLFISGLKEGDELVVEAPANASENMKVEKTDG